MEWIFVSVVFLTLVYAGLRYPKFRKLLLLSIGSLIVIGLAVSAFIYVEAQRVEERRQRSINVIKPNEIEMEVEIHRGTSFSFWDLKGTVTNASVHELETIALGIALNDCPEQGRCITVGESVALIRVRVPPKQKRAFTSYVYLDNVPALKKAEFTYKINETTVRIPE